MNQNTMIYFKFTTKTNQNTQETLFEQIAKASIQQLTSMLTSSEYELAQKAFKESPCAIDCIEKKKHADGATEYDVQIRLDKVGASC